HGGRAVALAVGARAAYARRGPPPARSDRSRWSRCVARAMRERRRGRRPAARTPKRPRVRASAPMPTPRTDQLANLIPRATELIATWEERFGDYSPHPASAPDPDRLAAAWE